MPRHLPRAGEQEWSGHAAWLYRRPLVLADIEGPAGSPAACVLAQLQSVVSCQRDSQEACPCPSCSSERRVGTQGHCAWHTASLRQLRPPEETGLGKGKGLEMRKVTLCSLPQGTQFGQWDTAGFDNEEQKLKFLKLMGGFKNLSPSLSRAPDVGGRPSMALSRTAADALQRSLQQDYERALRWKHSWGAGLGFPTAPRRAFYIDRNASRSVKFED